MDAGVEVCTANKPFFVPFYLPPAKKNWFLSVIQANSFPLILVHKWTQAQNIAMPSEVSVCFFFQCQSFNMCYGVVYIF